MRYTIGSVDKSVAAKNHSICDGPCAVLHVCGTGYPVGIGWSARTEEFTKWVCDAMNEKYQRDLVARGVALAESILAGASIETPPALLAAAEQYLVAERFK